MSAPSLTNRKKPYLGDEWKDWKGGFQDGLTDASAGKRIFIGLLGLTLLLFGVAGWLLGYLILPRLAQFHPLLPEAMTVLFLLLWLLCALWIASLVCMVIGRKHLFLRVQDTEICLTALLPLTQHLGSRLRISPDRVSHSFVRVSNILTALAAKPVKPNQLMILLPRCLKKSLRETIMIRAKARRIPVFTVPGGELARELIQQHHPKAVIGVACERDLFSGIRDTIRHTPVIGIPNKRPEGPCRNTSIDLNELEQAVKTFLGPNRR